ncbi:MULTISPECIES: serine/threonine-protein kinase [unclassified Streptomyces]|uniref:serine/threonine-protein kinase n=1 Tax=unclassified Streptomyces TaxID=2593676 RepID=UPI00336A4D46
MTGGGERHVDLTGSGARPLESSDPPRIGPYRILGVLGTGGMGRVYLGVDDSGRLAAVKQVLPHLIRDDHFLKHFRHELDNLARLPVGLSARLLAADRTERPSWFATEYVPGVDLAQARGLCGAGFPPAHMWLLMREVARSLAAVHALDVVHRDLKPSNVMLTLDGLKVIDFGVARAADQSRLTLTGQTVGTPAFMAPEQAMGRKQLTGAVDVFALGCLICYAAQGEPPFGVGSGPDVLFRVVHGDPELGPLRAADPDLADLVAACLAKDPADRPTAMELITRCAPNLPTVVTGDAAGEASPVWPAEVTAPIARRTDFVARETADGESPTAAATVQDRTAEHGTHGTTPYETAVAGEDPLDAPRRRRRGSPAVLAVAAVCVAAIAGLIIWGAHGTDRDKTAGGTGGAAGATTTPGTHRPTPSQTSQTSRTPHTTPPASQSPPSGQPWRPRGNGGPGIVPSGYTVLGGVDIAAYCRRQGPGLQAVLGVGAHDDVFGWRCGTPGGRRPYKSSDIDVSVEAACTQQYDSDAIAHYYDIDNAYSWQCWGP